MVDAIIKPLTFDTPDGEKPSEAEAFAADRTLLAYMGEDPEREGLLETPKRVAKAYRQLFAGYDQDARGELERTFEEVGGYDDIVLVRDIPFFSHCEHHIVPFYGKAHIAYRPDGRVVGLSKLARVLDIYARRLQTQEKLTAQIADTVNDVLQPRGVAVMIEGEHMCMSMRGIQKQGSSTVTTRFHGIFADESREQDRFLDLIRNQRS